MKNKKSIVLLGLLIMALVVSVGFAAWVIVMPTEDSSVGGTIKVETVEDHSWQFSTEWRDKEGHKIDDAVIVFGTPKDMDEKDTDWLKHSPDEVLAAEDPNYFVQNLSAKLFVKATGDFTDSVTTSYVTFEVKDDATTSFAKAVTAKYIKDPVVKVVTTHTDDEENVTHPETVINLTNFKGTVSVPAADVINGFDVVIEFAWGEALNFTNPFEYYNAQPVSDSLISEAKTVLAAIYELLDVKYNISLSTTNPDAAE